MGNEEWVIGRFPFPLPPFPEEPRKQHPLLSILNKLFIQEEQLKKAIIKWITKTNKHKPLQVQRQDGPAATGTASSRLNV